MQILDLPVVLTGQNPVNPEVFCKCPLAQWMFMSQGSLTPDGAVFIGIWLFAIPSRWAQFLTIVHFHYTSAKSEMTEKEIRNGHSSDSPSQLCPQPQPPGQQVTLLQKRWSAPQPQFAKETLFLFG